jgi:hypothetical protein
LLFLKKDKNKKYFFQGLRNPQILDLFNPSEVSIKAASMIGIRVKERAMVFYGLEELLQRF